MADEGKRCTICAAMRSHKPKTPIARVSRKKVEESLLVERLGLHEEWVETWEQDGKWVEESLAPTGLPPFIRATLRRDKVYEVEGHIERLVKAGCRQPVLYFCLEELSPDAAAVREGRRRKLVPGSDGEFNLSADWTEERPLATHEDLEAVTNNAKKARNAIHGYQRELLMVADTDEFRLPTGMQTVPVDAYDAFWLLKESLNWVASLAEAYTAPFEQTLLKSKGLIYLTAYVLAHADASKVRGRRGKGVGGEIAGLAKLITKKVWSPSDLREKLRKFEHNYPRLHKMLLRKLDELHRFHADQ